MSKRLPKPWHTIGIVVLIVLAIPVLCCVGMIVLKSTPYGLCFDIVSGHAPQIALERFIELVAKAMKEDKYEWLATVSEKDALQELILLKPNMTSHYTVKFTDDLGGLYEGDVHFDNGTVIHFNLQSIWPECPDYDVTDQEILKYIRLTYIMDAREYYRE